MTDVDNAFDPDAAEVEFLIRAGRVVESLIRLAAEFDKGMAKVRASTSTDNAADSTQHERSSHE